MTRDISKRLGGGVFPAPPRRDVAEVVRSAEGQFEALSRRNQRQKELLDRAAILMKDAVDECTCGGVERAVTNSGYVMGKPPKGKRDDGYVET